MQLGRKGWNNVVIFSMLLMIFFFNGLHTKLNSGPEEARVQSVLPDQSFILALEFPDQKIERIGTSWRAIALIDNAPLSQWQATTVNLVELINQWQNMQLSVAEEQPTFHNTTALTVATVWLAGEQLPWLYQLYRAPQGYYLLDKSNQRVLLLDQQTAQRLFPSFNFIHSEPKSNA
ncbi:hypothetical protein RC083_09720 [Pseudoalteromonas haloplanktis]|uniref:DUF4340 domain-containing protein n=1 Tax=Pseudoalteromonas haloplanktis TaxID=228 RepID=A0ABU1BBI5_PSEHA|nr:hypothetical protein [Pseudoalteromonas haloplanktis]MDQ9091866.1 hypothetical protein [Pseudoalteromonas haloplanktis]